MVDYTELQEEVVNALGDQPEADRIKSLELESFQTLVRDRYETARFFGQTHEDAVHYIANYLRMTPWQL